MAHMSVVATGKHAALWDVATMGSPFLHLMVPHEKCINNFGPGANPMKPTTLVKNKVVFHVQTANYRESQCGASSPDAVTLYYNRPSVLCCTRLEEAFKRGFTATGVRVLNKPLPHFSTTSPHPMRR
ncbi:hypothetical protein J6590_063234 [Homalodisca vitripennis]|nr:hypothetical protein J6590_063234 [Homalodisca vitripennis]